MSLRGSKAALGMFKNIEHLLARHPFVPFQEIIDVRTGFEMFKKNAYRQSGAFNRSSTVSGILF